MFLDTANVKDIEMGYQLGIIEGVTTNPSILQSEAINEATLIDHLSKKAKENIYFQVKGNTHEEMYAYFCHLKENLPSVFGIKIPITMDGLITIQRIKASDPETKILGTVIYTAAQGILASEAGCDYIAPYYNRILQEGGDSDEVIHKIRSYIDSHNDQTKILAASFKTVNQVVSSLVAGAHTCTLPLSLLKQMLTNKSVTQDLAVFNACTY